MSTSKTASQWLSADGLFLLPGSCAPSPSACCIAATSGLSRDRNQRTTVRMTRMLATLPMLSTPHGDQSNNELNLPRLREPIIMRQDSSNPEPTRPDITKTSKGDDAPAVGIVRTLRRQLTVELPESDSPIQGDQAYQGC